MTAKRKSKQMIKKCGRVCIICFLLIGIICSFQKNAKAKEDSIQIENKKTNLTAGTVYIYKAKTKQEDKTIRWSISNKKVGVINKKTGLFRAKRKGTTKITATSGNRATSLKVTIKGKKLIGIDAGHQRAGNSSLEAVGPSASIKKAKVAGGTTGVYTKVPEYRLTLNIAKQLKEELLNRGYDVVMTREKDDVNISNKERALKMNKAKADICIRLHADGSSTSSASGASGLYPSKKNKYVSNIVSIKSKKLSDTILKSYCNKTKIRNRGSVIRDDLTGTNWSKIPVIVLEMGFMTNRQDDMYMQSKKGQVKMVEGIANGVDNYYK